MKLPDEYVGCIIGKAGSVINNVKKVTGCQIKVSEKNAAADSASAGGGGGGEPSGIPSADQLPQTMIEGGNNSNNPLANENQQQQQLRSVVITGQESMVVRAYNMFFEQLSLNVYNRNR
jgi:transcription antitermination factor NusA-like protein